MATCFDMCRCGWTATCCKYECVGVARWLPALICVGVAGRLPAVSMNV
jgi:hypothetical protein